ncbi:MAG: alanine racemase [Patescibacteria group bacterium]
MQNTKNNYLSYIEISKNNLIHNIKQFRSIASPKTKIVAVLKSNAYGHGQNIVAKILEPYADYFQVNSIEELELLRKVSKKKTLLFGYVQSSDIKKAIKIGCILSVFSLSHLTSISAIAESGAKVQEVHLAVDAFLGREGTLLSDLPEFFREIKKCKYVKLTGIYAHFANIEDTHNLSHSKKQISAYKVAIGLAKEYGFKNLQTHISATSGLMIYEKNQNINSLVRLGIGIYGLWPAEHLKKSVKINLKPVLAWKTKVAQIKTLPKGHTIGYGLTYKTKKETKVAIIPQGYGDGLDRRLSNKGEFLIGGKRCKILGRVMMNMCVVDVSYLPKVKAEDEVVILGKQLKNKISAEDLAEKMGTINYEITTRLSALLPRVVV